jgi:hypothetical protein
MSINPIRFSGHIFWWVFIAGMIATTTGVAWQTRWYEATGELEIPRVVRESGGEVVETSSISSRVDLNTVIAILASKRMAEWVTSRLSEEEREAFLLPYGQVKNSDKDIARIIVANRTLAGLRHTLRIEIRYRHPDRRIAARVADLFLKEAVAYEARVRVDETIQAFAYLERRAEQAAREAGQASAAVLAYREERPGLIESAWSDDESYQALVKKAEKEKQVHAMILARIADARAMDKHESGWRISRSPQIPETNKYLLRPLVVMAAQGLVIAVITGIVAAVLFSGKRTRQPSVVLSEKGSVIP